MDEKLRDAFETKTWAQEDKGKPRSGPGSTLRRTKRLRRALPGLLRDLEVRTFFDGACGDWTWMAGIKLDGIDYIGGDISKELIEEVSEKHAGPGRKFIHADLSSDKLPKCDLIMVRECLIHLTDKTRWKIIANIHKAKIPYLLLTTDLVEFNIPLKADGDHGNFNPMMPPFNFPMPDRYIAESSDELDLTEVSSENVGPWTRRRAMCLWTHAQLGEVLKGRPKS